MNFRLANFSRTYLILLFLVLFTDLALAKSTSGMPCVDQKTGVPLFSTVDVSGHEPAESYSCDPQTPGTIYRGSRPNTDGIAALYALGVKTVLDLESEGTFENEKQEITYWGRNENVNPRHIQINVLNVEVPLEPSPILDTKLIESLQILKDPVNYPVYVHCQRGRDRTGIVISTFRMLSGWDTGRVVKERETFLDFWSHSLYANLNRFAGDTKYIQEKILSQIR